MGFLWKPTVLFGKCSALTETSQQDMDKKDLIVIFISTYLCFYRLSTVQASNETKSEKQGCDKYSNRTCGECISAKGCYYCETTKECASDLIKGVLHSSCKDLQWKAGQCVFTGKILLIVIPSIGGAILITLCCVIYCCCCRKKKRGSRKETKEEARWKRKREEIDLKHTQRRAERQVKYDEIRKKYGLYKNADGEAEDGKYHQFSNEA